MVVNLIIGLAIYSAVSMILHINIILSSSSLWSKLISFLKCQIVKTSFPVFFSYFFFPLYFISIYNPMGYDRS